MAGGGGLANRRAVDELAGAPAELAKALRKQYRAAARQAALRAQARIRGATSRHPGDLREHIAATVTTNVTQRATGGVTATISSLESRMPPGEKNLPAYANAGSRRWRRWRHPVWGHDRWVSQDWASARGWFDATLQAERGNFEEATRKALDDLAARLGG